VSSVPTACLLICSDLGFPEEEVTKKAAQLMKIYDKDSDGQLDEAEFVKLYAHFKEKESARLAHFAKDLQAIAITKVRRLGRGIAGARFRLGATACECASGRKKSLICAAVGR
jgi:hypothetical protein